VGQCGAVALSCYLSFALQKYKVSYLDSDIVVIVYDVTQDGKSNNVCSWYEEAVKHCPEKAIKILVGNKTDLLDRINKKSSFNALDSATWNIIASEKINYY
jgi:ferredoxin